jgi:hypothetical protein
VQRADDRNPQVAHEGQHMPTRCAAVDAELMLQTNHVDISKVQVVGRPPVGCQFLFLNFEADLGRIVVAAFDVVDRNDNALNVGILACHRIAQVERKRGDATFAWHVIGHEGDLANIYAAAH